MKRFDRLINLLFYLYEMEYSYAFGKRKDIGVDFIVGGGGEGRGEGRGQ